MKQADPPLPEDDDEFLKRQIKILREQGVNLHEQENPLFESKKNIPNKKRSKVVVPEPTKEKIDVPKALKGWVLILTPVLIYFGALEFGENQVHLFGAERSFYDLLSGVSCMIISGVLIYIALKSFSEFILSDYEGLFERVFLWLDKVNSIPALLGLIGAVVGSIWLLFLGEWKILLACAGYVLLAMLGFWILMLPGVGLCHLFLILREKKWTKLSAVFRILQQLYQAGVYSLWCLIFIKVFVLNKTSEPSFMPLLLIAHQAAIGPLAHFDVTAQKTKTEDVRDTLLLLTTSLSHSIAIAMAYFGCNFNSIVAMFSCSVILLIAFEAPSYIKESHEENFE